MYTTRVVTERFDRGGLGVFEHTTANPKGLMICYPWCAVPPVKGQRDKGFTTPPWRAKYPPICPPNYLPKGR